MHGFRKFIAGTVSKEESRSAMPTGMHTASGVPQSGHARWLLERRMSHAQSTSAGSVVLGRLEVVGARGTLYDGFVAIVPRVFMFAARLCILQACHANKDRFRIAAAPVQPPHTQVAVGEKAKHVCVCVCFISVVRVSAISVCVVSVFGMFCWSHLGGTRAHRYPLEGRVELGIVSRCFP